MLRLIPYLFLFSAVSTAFAQSISYIEPNGKKGSAQMPRIVINTRDYGTSELTFKTTSEHKKRGTKDNVRITNTGASQIWNVNESLKYKIFGGNAYITNRDGSKVFRQFKIRDNNPKDADAIAFIKANARGHWYAYAIAKHESRQRYYVFNQFNSSYYKKSIVGIPNCGLPDGWGIMQIDSKRGSQITTDEVYNWQRNVLSGIAVMDKAKSEAVGYFNAVKRTFPQQWEEPPVQLILPGTKTALSYLDACVIQLYNGASEVRRLKTAYGTYSYYRSAFVFDENAPRGKRWTFKPNVNQYVYKVVSHEIEGGVKSENEPLR